MKVISIWQPYASLAIHRFKVNETRGWPAPKSIIGTRIGIAATKNITPAQRVAYLNPDFRRFYRLTGLPPLEELPCGCILGTAEVVGCDQIDEDLLDEFTDEEKEYGHYQIGNYVWYLRNPIAFEHPITARGQQGLWEWRGDKALQRQKDTDHTGQERPQDIRRHLRIA